MTGVEHMCLAIPMKVVELEGSFGKVEAEGVRRKVSLQLLPDVNLGDYVLVHAGFAIEKIDEQEAKRTLDLLAELALAQEGEP
jgi:hydrogenase expression/formation protein HypC